MKKELKRLVIAIEKELHKEIKRRALNRNASIKQWMLMAIAEQLERERMYE